MRQVITVWPDGSLQSLRVPSGKGIDLCQFGEADIVRVSEIEWDSPSQKWYIQLRNIIPSRPTIKQLIESGLSSYKIANFEESHDSIALFLSYETAVESEVNYLNYLRLQGIY